MTQSLQTWIQPTWLWSLCLLTPLVTIDFLTSPRPALAQATSPVSAATNEVLNPDPAPLDVARLLDSSAPVDCFTDFSQLSPGTVLTSETICQESLTLPSLWWTKVLFESKSPTYNKLVTNWLTYLPQVSQPGRVDLIVDVQRWTVMDYFDRYQFINTFGSTAASFGYNSRVFNLRGERIAAYTCEFTNSPGAETLALQPDRCQIQVESVGLRSRDDILRN